MAISKLATAERVVVMRIRTAFKRKRSMPMIFAIITVRNKATDVMRLAFLIWLSYRKRKSMSIVKKMAMESGALM